MFRSLEELQQPLPRHKNHFWPRTKDFAEDFLAAKQLSLSLRHSAVSRQFVQLLRSTATSKINSYLSTYNSFILSILAATVPYTIGVSFDDIEYHKTVADGKADGSEQMVAPGKYLYPRLIILLSEVYSNTFCRLL